MPRRRAKPKLDPPVEGARPELRIPYALDEGGCPVVPAYALRERRYVCPECRQPVIFRAGEVKAWHFAHIAASPACALETDQHALAKHALYAALFEWLLSGDRPDLRPLLMRVCPACRDLAWERLPPWVARVALEHRIVLPAGGHRIADVACLSADGRLCLAFEIRHSHAVDKAKSLDLAGVAWLELSALDVLRSARRLVVLTGDNFQFPPCNCGHISLDHVDLAAQVAARLRDAARAEQAYYAWPGLRELFDAHNAYRELAQLLDRVKRFSRHPLFHGAYARVSARVKEWTALLDARLQLAPLTVLSRKQLREDAGRLRHWTAPAAEPDTMPAPAAGQQLDLFMAEADAAVLLEEP